MTGFQRARSAEQREVRRQAILDAAAGMLAEMPVAEISLTELSRRAGLAKSNVLRYFDSREAVLLELLDDAWREWLAGLATALAPLTDHPDRAVETPAREPAGTAPVARGALGTAPPRGEAATVGEPVIAAPAPGAPASAVGPAAPTGGTPAAERAGAEGLVGVGDDGPAGARSGAGGDPVGERRERVAAVVAGSLAARPVLCDLLGAQAAVLERNVSPAVAARFKRAAIDNIAALGGLLAAAVPELGAARAERVAAATVLVAGALWAHGQPSAAVLAAYEADPSLAVYRLDFGATLTELMAVLLAGVLARSG